MKKLDESKVRTSSTKQNGENTANVEETGNASTHRVKKLRARCSIQMHARLFILSACLSACLRNYSVYSLSCCNILDMTCNFYEQDGKDYRFIVVREMGFELYMSGISAFLAMLARVFVSGMQLFGIHMRYICIYCHRHGYSSIRGFVWFNSPVIFWYS